MPWIDSVLMDAVPLGSVVIKRKKTFFRMLRGKTDDSVSKAEVVPALIVDWDGSSRTTNASIVKVVVDCWNQARTSSVRVFWLVQKDSG
jgi:hypothetical protein